MKKYLRLLLVCVLMVAAFALGRVHSHAGLYSTREVLEISREREKSGVNTTLRVQLDFLNKLNDIERDELIKFSRSSYEEAIRKLLSKSLECSENEELIRVGDQITIMQAQCVEMRRTHGKPSF